MSTVYVVETGDYSDRHVVAVCSTEENAKEIVRMTNGEANYTPFALDEFLRIPPDHTLWCIMRGPSDTGLDITHRWPSEELGVTDWASAIQPGKTFPWASHVAARDADHAVKIVAEKWAMWKAIHPPATAAKQEPE